MKTVFCPVMGKAVNGTDCLIICDVADKLINPRVLPEGVEWSEEQRKKCKECQYHADITYTHKSERKTNMKRVYDFLKEAGTYYIATIDGEQPRVRPFGTVNIYEGKLYIQTGKGKAVNEQILANGKVELCAMKGDEWIRVSGTLVADHRVEAGEAMLDAYPNLRNMYTTGENGNSVVYYFKDATAVISAFGHAPEIIKF